MIYRNVLKGYLNEDIDEVEDKIYEFFVNNPNPKDDQIHKFSEEFGIDKHVFEGYIYKVLSSLIHMKGSEVPDENFDSKELERGIEVEKEHHEHIVIRKNIAKAHLLESPKYYIELEKMEAKLEEE